jgi:CDP-ribitol ribitolphosphotransferase
MNIKKYTFKSKKVKQVKDNKFTIITATYNCQEYLDDYFKALLNQNYPLQLINIIIVDDGSTDKTEELVNQYSDKLSIKYIYQHNQGVATARNNGIIHAENNYISFIDADDMVGVNYFKNLNYSINAYPDASLYVSNLLYYFESTKETKNIHYLKDRFTTLKFHYQIDLLNNPKWFVIHMSSCIFKKELINKPIRDIKPQFEDAFFINEYLKDNNKHIVFNNKAIYLYRKRMNNNSTIDQVGINPMRYVDLLENGYLALLELYAPNIPDYIKNVVNYDYKFNKLEFEETSIKIDLKRRKQLIKQIDQYLKK